MGDLANNGGQLPEPTVSTPLATADAFPIVGLGASAVGLEAPEQFLKPVPPDSGMAFVVVQHLDPTHPGLLPELLQRTTALPVAPAKDRLRVQPNHVFVIPPNKDLSLLHGVLHLFEPASPRGLRLSIDFFFRSLAEDRRERSVGIILSGMGSDGTLGLRAIQERALVEQAIGDALRELPRLAAGQWDRAVHALHSRRVESSSKPS